jgi:hypothetical protein
MVTEQCHVWGEERWGLLVLITAAAFLPGAWLKGPLGGGGGGGADCNQLPGCMLAT